MDHLEIELKFFFSDFNRLRLRLADFGAVCTAPNTYEHNVRYETADEGLLQNGCLLRLRRNPGAVLTYKSAPPQIDDRFKTYRELEVRVDDFAAMDAILQALGFRRRQVYEKWRETWQLDATTLCLDTMPYGRFLEIEGAPESILEVVQRLGLRWEQRILNSYLGLFALLREQEALPFEDLTFDNFKAYDIHFARYRHIVEVGPGR